MVARRWLRIPGAIGMCLLAGCAGEPLGEAPVADRTEPTGAGPSTAMRGDAWALRPTLQRLGCEGALAAADPASPETHGDRIEYPRAALTEWYRGTPRGLEQGFTLPVRPACPGAGPVILALGGSLSAMVLPGGREARLRDASGHEVLRYTDLHASDRTGRELPASLAAMAGGLAIRVDDTGAEYPVEVDPLIWAEQQDLVASDPGPTPDAFGQAVAVDGDTLLVGAPGNQGFGSAYLFVRSGPTWSFAQEFTGDSHSFGQTVSLSGDTALTGASDVNEGRGAAYVFSRSGTTWAEQQMLVDPGGSPDDSFGAAVATSGDTAVIGAPGLIMAGVAYVFAFAGGTWTQQQALTDGMVILDAGESDGFGGAVALSGDTLLVGAPNDASTSGAAYVFVRSGTTWTLQQKLVPVGGVPGGNFGVAVALDGDTAALGDWNATSNEGLVHVFGRTGTVWTQTQVIAAVPTIASFGASVALNGGTLVAGGNTYAGPSGGVYVYTPSSGGALALVEVLTPQPAVSGNGFGIAVAVSGNTVAAGAPLSLKGAGSAYVFVVGSTLGDACTAPEQCFSGLCVDGVCCNFAACPAAGPCNATEHCQAGTGLCSITPLNEGTACTDPAACVLAGTCTAGVCSGGTTPCVPEDDCHEFGVCDGTTGLCSNPAKPDGLPCPGGTCAAGICAATGTGGSGAAAMARSGCTCGTAGQLGDGTLAPALGLLLLALRRRSGAKRPRHPLTDTPGCWRTPSSHPAAAGSPSSAWS